MLVYKIQAVVLVLLPCTCFFFPAEPFLASLSVDPARCFPAGPLTHALHQASVRTSSTQGPKGAMPRSDKVGGGNRHT
jgi:hypothetical protein